MKHLSYVISDIKRESSFVMTSTTNILGWMSNNTKIFSSVTICYSALSKNKLILSHTTTKTTVHIKKINKEEVDK